MRFLNIHPTHELNFNILGKDYKVPLNGEVDIEPAHVPYVVSRGIMLTPGSKPRQKPSPAKESSKPAEPKPVEAEAPKAAKSADTVKPSE